MKHQRVSARISHGLGQRLRHHSLLKGEAESAIIREALETYLSKSHAEKSAYELFAEAGLIGCMRGAPKDLSTNRRHFAKLGKAK